jgi:hypothetical protein
MDQLLSSQVSLRFNEQDIDQRVSHIRVSSSGFGSTASQLPFPAIVNDEMCTAQIIGIILDIQARQIALCAWAPVDSPQRHGHDYTVAYGFGLRADHGRWIPSHYVVRQTSYDRRQVDSPLSLEHLSFGVSSTWD